MFCSNKKVVTPKGYCYILKCYHRQSFKNLACSFKMMQ